MAIVITHAKVSGISDGSNSALVQPSDWNDAHTVSGTLPAANVLPAGSDTQVQFNDGGAVGADSDFVYNKTTNTLTVGGNVVETAGKHTLWIPASAMNSRVTAGAGVGNREINSITVPSKAFDQTTAEGVNFSFAFPKSWAAGTLTAQAFWTATGGAAAETLEFEISGGCFANDAAINVTGLGTAVAMTDTWIADNDVHVTAESSAITLSNAADDTVAFFLIVRDVANDTLTADAELIGIKLFYTTDAATDA